VRQIYGLNYEDVTCKVDESLDPYVLCVVQASVVHEELMIQVFTAALSSSKESVFFPKPNCTSTIYERSEPSWSTPALFACAGGFALDMEKELDLFTARSGNRRLGECGDRRRRGALEAERSAALK
jgi:hypothetical protein